MIFDVQLTCLCICIFLSSFVIFFYMMDIFSYIIQIQSFLSILSDSRFAIDEKKEDEITFVNLIVRYDRRTTNIMQILNDFVFQSLL